MKFFVILLATLTVVIYVTAYVDDTRRFNTDDLLTPSMPIFIMFNYIKFITSRVLQLLLFIFIY